MSFKCKYNDTIKNVEWRFIRGAWLPAITVCINRLYDTREINVNSLSVTTDELTVNNFMCHAYGTVAGSGITEYGFVYAANTETPTTANHKQIVGSEQFNGSFDDTIDVGTELDGEDLTGGSNPVWFAAYATNGSTTVYGEVLQTDPNPWICLIEGTLVTLSNGTTKKIENVTYEDELSVWNFDEARLDKAKPVWMVKPFKAPRYSLIKFSNGLELGTIDDGKGHSVFNIEKGMFTHMMSENTPIGTSIYTKNGDIIQVISKEVVHEEISFYNVVTNVHMNVFTNNILTSTGLNNIYPIKDMKFTKVEVDKTNIDLSDIPKTFITGLRLNEQSVEFKEKVLRMINRQG